MVYTLFWGGAVVLCGVKEIARKLQMNFRKPMQRTKVWLHGQCGDLKKNLTALLKSFSESRYERERGLTQILPLRYPFAELNWCKPFRQIWFRCCPLAINIPSCQGRHVSGVDYSLAQSTSPVILISGFTNQELRTFVARYVLHPSGFVNVFRASACDADKVW